MDEIAEWFNRTDNASLDDWKKMTFLLFRQNLERIPAYPLPAGYLIRGYRPGDEDGWTDIWQSASLDRMDCIVREMFDPIFDERRSQLARRLLFVQADDGTLVGTCAAWHCRSRGKRWGGPHWFAVAKDHQGRGLGKCVLAECLRALRSLGHVRSMVGTQTIRLGAVKTYLDLGFAPEDEDKKALLRKYITHRALKASCRARRSS